MRHRLLGTPVGTPRSVGGALLLLLLPQAPPGARARMVAGGSSSTACCSVRLWPLYCSWETLRVRLCSPLAFIFSSRASSFDIRISSSCAHSSEVWIGSTMVSRAEGPATEMTSGAAKATRRLGAAGGGAGSEGAETTRSNRSSMCARAWPLERSEEVLGWSVSALARLGGYLD